MVADPLQWMAVVVEVGGLLLIAIELYFQSLSERLKALFDETQPDFQRRPGIWIGAYVSIWIFTTAVLSIFDMSMSVVANIAFSIVTTLILVLMGISKLLVRLGVALGRGNSVGGVGLVMALMGVSIELVQLFLA